MYCCLIVLTEIYISITHTQIQDSVLLYYCLCVFQTYKVIFTRKQIPRYIRLNDPALSMQYECPVSLTALYQPVTIKDSEPRHTLSAPIIDEFTKTSKLDPISETPLVGDWRVEDYGIDKKLSDASGCIPMATGGVYPFLKFSLLLRKALLFHLLKKITQV